MIDPTTLKNPDDIRRKVIFRNKDEGWIFAFSKVDILVVYPPKEYAELTNPRDLDFVQEENG